MSGDKQMYKIRFKNITPHKIYYNLFINNKKVKKICTFDNLEGVCIELVEYNVFTSKYWWFLSVIVAIISLGSVSIWDDVRNVQRHITLTLVNIQSNFIDLSIQNDENNLNIIGAEILKKESFEITNDLITKRANAAKIIVVATMISVLLIIATALLITFLMK